MEVPEPVHTMLTDKETKEDAVAKYKKRKEMETVICPPTCTGIIVSSFNKDAVAVNKDAVANTGGEDKLTYLVGYIEANYDYFYRSYDIK